MNNIKRLIISVLLFMLAACGGGSGDTTGLKQSVEQNKLNITSITLNSNFTQTLVPVNSAGVTPKFYFIHGDNSEQITVTGFNDNGENKPLTTASFSLLNSTGSTTIDQDGRLILETLAGANMTKEITVQATFGSLSNTATIVISSYSVQAGGLSLLINNNIVNGLTQEVPVCYSQPIAAKASYGDGSTRTVTQKVIWSNSTADNNAKFNVANPSNPLFSAHTNNGYLLTVPFDGQSETVTMNVSQVGLSNFAISPTSKTLQLGVTQLLSLSGLINNVTTTGLETTAKWSSADSNIASINTATGVVTGKALGSADITATCGSVTQISSITVNQIELQSVEIRDNFGNSQSVINFSLQVNEVQTKRLSLYAVYTDGSEGNVSFDDSIVWSDNGNKVTLSVNIDTDKGLVTARGADKIIVFATYRGFSDSIRVESVVTN